MPNPPADRPTELAALDVLVGDWTVRVQLPEVPPGQVRFEWAVNDRYLIERSTIPAPEFPDSLAIIAYAPVADGLVQHYFDSRGVVRLYQMTLRGHEWTLLRTAPDFTPLDFSQRFIGTFSADRSTIQGRWETSNDGGDHWELDFGLDYARRPTP